LRRGLRQNLLGYVPKDSAMHALCGAAKLSLVLGISLAAMLTFNPWFLGFLILASIVLFRLSRAHFREFAFMIAWIAAIMAINNIAIFLFAPGYGEELYHSRDYLASLPFGYVLTAQQLYYQMVVTLKYIAIVPAALIFFYSTQPGELAYSLSALGVHYKISWAVSLALRYIPDIQRQFVDIKQAQEARGADITTGVSLVRRVKSAFSIIFPLILSSMDSIDTIANAMELRGFGKYESRSWYVAKPFSGWDYVAFAFSVAVLAASILLNILTGRIYNPFTV